MQILREEKHWADSNLAGAIWRVDIKFCTQDTHCRPCMPHPLSKLEALARSFWGRLFHFR